MMGRVFGMAGGQIDKSLSRFLFKSIRLPYLIKYYISRGKSRAIRSDSKSNGAIFVNDAHEYQILGGSGLAPISIRWPERFSGPVNKFSDLDGYWPVDVVRLNRPQNLYHIYWLHPFDCNLHVWIVSESGERLGSFDPNAFYKYRFFLDRLQKSEIFAVRLYMLCAEWGDDQTCHAIKSDVLAAAMSGSAEAIYCVLSVPKLFSVDELRICIEGAVYNINNICGNAAPARDRQAQLVIVEALAQVLEAYDSKYDWFSKADIQEKIDYFEAFGDIRYASLQPQMRNVSIFVHDHISNDNYMGLNFNKQSIAIIGKTNESILNFHVLNSNSGARKRVMNCIGYAAYLLSMRQQKKCNFLSQNIENNWIIDFETGDLPSQRRCISFVRASGCAEILLIPDIYYYSSWGFRSGWIDGAVPPWSSKRTVFTWRGITTGGHDHTVDSISTLPRFRMCAIASELGPLADIGFSQIVQSRSADDSKCIESYLKSIGLFKNHIPPHIMGRSKFLLEIDGNSNSWGFFAKLLMGCCVLKVDSPFEQWFYQDLKPWVHYVPIAHDLSNLVETMEWCLQNESACRDIAHAGMAFAEERTFDREMKAAAATMAAFARPLD